MTEQNQIAENSTALHDSIWGVEPAQVQVQSSTAEENQQVIKEEQPTTQVLVEEPKQTEPDYNSFVKEKFGFDNVEIALQEFEKVKNFKLEEPKYKTVEELFGDKEQDIADYLSNKQRLERLSKAELDNNIDAASEIIKLSMRQKNTELTNEDADFILSEKFSIPNKPTQDVDELDEDYTRRVTQWQDQANRVQRQMIIEAKMAKPELEKLRTQLKLPEIYTPAPPVTQPDQAELDRLQAVREGYVNTLNEDYKKFEGYATPYKDEVVEFTVPFTISDEEKESLKVELENFDSDSFFGERWFTKEGKPNVNQMMADLYLLKNRDKVFQKIANEAGSQRFLHHAKQTGNINVNGEPQGTFVPDNKTSNERLLDSIWSN